MSRDREMIDTRSHVPDDEMLAQLAQYPTPDRMAWLRCIGVRPSASDTWELAFARLDFAKPDALGTVASSEFERLIAVVDQLSISDALERFRTAFVGRELVCAARAFRLPRVERQVESWHLGRVQSSNEYCEWPALVGYRPLAHAYAPLPRGPFASRSGDFYETAEGLMIEHSGITGLDIGNQRMRSIVVCLWDYCARFKSVTHDNGELHVNIDGDVLQAPCRIVGEFFGDVPSRFSVAPGTPIAIPPGSRRVHLVLLAPGDRILDRATASFLRTASPVVEIDAIVQIGDEHDLEVMLRCGPNERAEAFPLQRR